MTQLIFKNKKITVMGLGLHGGGFAVTRFLAEQGAKVTVTDLKTSQQLASTIRQLKAYKIRYVLGRHEINDFIKADLIIKNPGVPSQSPYLLAAIKKGVAIETDLSLFFKLCPSSKIIGITGTRGKSTTTSLIYQLIKTTDKKVIIGGNIRISPLDCLNKIKPSTPIVLELSSWQLEGLGAAKVSPSLAVVLNVMRDHLNTYKNFADYIKAKSYIFKFQKSNDRLVLNKDNVFTRKMAGQTKVPIFWFSLKKLAQNETGAYLDNDWLVWQASGKKEKLISLKDIKLKGRHNINNVLAALVVAKNYGIKNQLIKKVVQQFKGIEGRLQLIRQYQGIQYYNDTTATSPDGTIAALRSFNNKVVLLAGGTDKNLEFKELAKVIKEKVRVLILFEGTATQKLVGELKKIKFGQPLYLVNSMKDAMKQARLILQPKDIFILSPGAASFGIFVNEFDRGAQFNQQVLKIK